MDTHAGPDGRQAVFPGFTPVFLISNFNLLEGGYVAVIASQVIHTTFAAARH